MKIRWHGVSSMPIGKTVVVMTVTGRMRLARASKYDKPKVKRGRFVRHCWNHTPGISGGDLSAVYWTDDLSSPLLPPPSLKRKGEAA